MDKRLIASVVVVGGLVLAYYYLVKKPYDLKKSTLPNDDRTTYYGKDKKDYIRGYKMPNKISDLKPIKGEIFIATKPDTDVFGQKPRSGINLIVNVKDNTLMYKFNDNETWIDNYDSLKDKIVLMNKKYL